MFALVLGGLVHLAQQDGVRDHLPLRPDRDLSQAVQESAHNLDPQEGGWAREDLAQEAHLALEFVAEFLEGGGDGASLRSILLPGVRATPWVPAELEDRKSVV